MKIKPCPFCPEKMYIYMKQERWVCADHANCGYTLDATPDEIAAAINVYSKRVRRDWGVESPRKTARANGEHFAMTAGAARPDQHPTDKNPIRGDERRRPREIKPINQPTTTKGSTSTKEIATWDF
jgi:hypothetical protein